MYLKITLLFTFLHFASFSQYTVKRLPDSTSSKVATSAPVIQKNVQRLVDIDSTVSSKWKNLTIDSTLLKMNFNGADGGTGSSGSRGNSSYDKGGDGTSGSHGSSGSNGGMGTDITIWYTVKIYEKDTLVFFHLTSNTKDVWQVQKYGKARALISVAGGKGGNGGDGGKGGGGGDFNERNEVGKGGDGGDGGHAGNGGNGGRIQVITDSVSYRYFQHFSIKVDGGLGGQAGMGGSSGSDGMEDANTKGGQIFNLLIRSRSGRNGRDGMNGMSGMNGTVDFRFFPLVKVREELQ